MNYMRVIQRQYMLAPRIVVNHVEKGLLSELAHIAWYVGISTC